MLKKSLLRFLFWQSAPLLSVMPECPSSDQDTQTLHPVTWSGDCWDTSSLDTTCWPKCCRGKLKKGWVQNYYDIEIDNLVQFQVVQIMARETCWSQVLTRQVISLSCEASFIVMNSSSILNVAQKKINYSLLGDFFSTLVLTLPSQHSLF